MEFHRPFRANAQVHSKGTFSLSLSVFIANAQLEPLARIGESWERVRRCPSLLLCRLDLQTGTGLGRDNELLLLLGHTSWDSHWKV